MTLKRIILTSTLALSCGLSAIAQQSDAYSSFVAKAASSRAEFTYSFVAGALKGAGKAVVQDDCFLVEGNGLKIVCDGKKLWTIDAEAREAVVEDLDLSDAEAMYANPALLVSNIESLFKLRSSHSATVSGKSAVKLTLAPLIDDEMKSLVACVSPDGEKLLQLTALMQDGTVTSFTIPSFRFAGKSDKSIFYVNEKEFDSSWVITDFR